MQGDDLEAGGVHAKENVMSLIQSRAFLLCAAGNHLLALGSSVLDAPVHPHWVLCL